jgi:hypothetical protein
MFKNVSLLGSSVYFLNLNLSLRGLHYFLTLTLALA